MRGRLSSVQQVMIIAGLTGAFLGNYFLAHVAGRSTEVLWLGYAAWRWMFWMQVIPASIFLLTLLFIPESPRYLVARGRHEEAVGVLTRLFGAASAAAKALEIKGSLTADHTPRLADLIDRSTGRWRRIVWVGIGLATFQQLVGINVVFYYGAVLWQAVGFSEADSLKINILSGTLSIAACLVAIFLIDRIGRKPLLYDRLDRHGRYLGGPDDCVRDRKFQRRHTAPRAPGRQAGPDQRQSLRGLFQFQLGPGHVGDAGRDVPQPDPRLRAWRSAARRSGPRTS